ncbi:hypothetical protein D3C74_470780 [compost metagenome]
MKKCAPANLSRKSNASVTVKIGNANKIMIQVENTDHVNIGSFIHFMPGARILMMVTIKLIPVAREPIPDIWIPHI